MHFLSIAVAPMLDWTDRHFRFFLRQISRHTILTTEMVVCDALIHGRPETMAQLLAYAEEEHPLVLQLGGSDPTALARCARMALDWGYDALNLNVGCPSDRVRSGRFGACLMAEPTRVAACLAAMHEASGLPVSVKHRIGLGHEENYPFLRDFVGTVAGVGTPSGTGCRSFIVHARNAILHGLSPKQNREIPPLRYAAVYRLKRDFPQLRFILNGGLQDWDQVDALAGGTAQSVSVEQHSNRAEGLPHGACPLDGAMIGRMAYHDPYRFAVVDERYYGATVPPSTRLAVLEKMTPYLAMHLAQGGQLRHLARHLLGLYQGCPGARRWRRTLSDPHWLATAGADGLLRAGEAQEQFAAG